MTLEQDAKKYHHAMNYAAPNAWGQILIDGGQSHFFLIRMCRKYGQEETERALDALFKK